jgi:hypothetical protein
MLLVAARDGTISAAQQVPKTPVPGGGVGSGPGYDLLQAEFYAVTVQGRASPLVNNAWQPRLRLTFSLYVRCFHNLHT